MPGYLSCIPEPQLPRALLQTDGSSAAYPRLSGSSMRSFACVGGLAQRHPGVSAAHLPEVCRQAAHHLPLECLICADPNAFELKSCSAVTADDNHYIVMNSMYEHICFRPPKRLLVQHGPKRIGCRLVTREERHVSMAWHWLPEQSQDILED